MIEDTLSLIFCHLFQYVINKLTPIFIVIFSEKSKRRTKTLACTNEPKWNQSFVFSSVRRSDLDYRTIEITVWDYVRFAPNDFLGEVSICSLYLDITNSFTALMNFRKQGQK